MSESRSGGADKFASAIPRGVYVPPGVSPSTDRATDGVDPSPTQADGIDGPRRVDEQHGGYVRIIDSRGKKFHCAFSRPVGSALEPAVAGRKRPRPQSALDASANLASGEADGSERYGSEGPQKEATTGAEGALRKVTITEDRLHPEEALFLHIRGLLRIERISQKEAENGSPSATATETDGSSMSTQDLFCQMLPQCKVPLAAYLAYAHLRAQGYILMRYSENRMGLLCRLGEADSESISQKDVSESEETSTTKTPRSARFKDRNLRSKMSEDVATAPPPCVVNLKTDRDDGTPKIRLAYYAYNPNARFKRTNPGVPDFGVAVMPYRPGDENGPTFDDLGALVAMCDGGERATSIPLRVVTIADGGAAIAFGVARGEVPSINQGKG